MIDRPARSILIFPRDFTDQLWSQKEKPQSLAYTKGKEIQWGDIMPLSLD